MNEQFNERDYANKVAVDRYADQQAKNQLAGACIGSGSSGSNGAFLGQINRDTLGDLLDKKISNLEFQLKEARSIKGKLTEGRLLEMTPYELRQVLGL